MIAILNEFGYFGFEIFPFEAFHYFGLSGFISSLYSLSTMKTEQNFEFHILLFKGTPYSVSPPNDGPTVFLTIQGGDNLFALRNYPLFYKD